ncbi:WD-40 repeat-containing protein [Reticulomyxa filosa]|uniref:WD-40 repeat-containing protein n=1 Tax=Reticulomyxa filosa TaxID=46433 RepID=X6LL59_RETFI|nr:WD-40 repeat-containing protein [Reticulomyxa filosa]|eukprot:ETO01857.1 WD-40 repeat-containing protein [Reticulomyxa filosa]
MIMKITKKRQKEISMVVHYWTRTLLIHFGWIDDFIIVIARYLLMKYFKLAKEFNVHPNIMNDIRLSPNGNEAVDIGLGKEVKVLKGHSLRMNTAQYSPRGAIIVSCSEDNTIRLWNATSGQKIRKLNDGLEGLTCAKFSPDGNSIISCSMDKIMLWDIHSGKHYTKLFEDVKDEREVQFSSDGNKIISSCGINIIVRDVLSGRIINIFSYPAMVTRTQFSPNDFFIVSCAENAIQIWDGKSTNALQVMNGHFKEIANAIFSPDGQTIISCSDDKTIRLWDVKSELEIQKLKGHSDKVQRIDISSDELLFLPKKIVTMRRKIVFYFPQKSIFKIHSQNNLK